MVGLAWDTAYATRALVGIRVCGPDLWWTTYMYEDGVVMEAGPGIVRVNWEPTWDAGKWKWSPRNSSFSCQARVHYWALISNSKYLRHATLNTEAPTFVLKDFGHRKTNLCILMMISLSIISGTNNDLPKVCKPFYVVAEPRLVLA